MLCYCDAKYRICSVMTTTGQGKCAYGRRSLSYDHEDRGIDPRIGSFVCWFGSQLSVMFVFVRQV
jgi:hypothetical protein